MSSTTVTAAPTTARKHSRLPRPARKSSTTRIPTTKHGFTRQARTFPDCAWDAATSEAPAPPIPPRKRAMNPTVVAAAKSAAATQGGIPLGRTKGEAGGPSPMPASAAKMKADKQDTRLESTRKANAGPIPALAKMMPCLRISNEELDTPGPRVLHIPLVPSEGDAAGLVPAFATKTLPSLIPRDEQLGVLTPEVLGQLRKVFPGIRAVVEGPYMSYLHLTVDCLPPKAWPLAVGGIPLTIATATAGRGPLFPRAPLIGNTGVSVLRHYTVAEDVRPVRDSVLRQIASEIHHLFCTSLPDLGPPVEVILTSERLLYLVFSGRVDLVRNWGRLPGKMGGARVGYLWDEDMRRPQAEDEKERPSVALELAQLFGEGIKSAGDWRDRVYLEDPLDDDIAPMGILAAKSARIQDGPPPTLQHPRRATPRFAVYDWAYTGQAENRARPTSGTRGSVLRDDKGIARGLVQYHIRTGPWAGFCVSLSASEVGVSGGESARPSVDAGRPGLHRRAVDLVGGGKRG